MNTPQQVVHDTSPPGCVLHLTLRENEAGFLTNDPGKMTERLIEEVSMRATVVGSVLEGILLEAQGQPRWGLNE